MSKYKQLIIGVLIGGSLCIGTSAMAEDGLQKIEAYLRPDLPITLNGQKVSLNDSPIMYQGNTYIRLRNLQQVDPNLQVNWNDSTQTVEISTTATVTGGTYGNGSTTTTIPVTSTNPVTNVPSTTSMIFYNAMDVNHKYPATSHRTLDNGHVLWTINGVEVDQQAILTDKDKFHIDGTSNVYFSENYFLHYLTKNELSQFQKYKVDFNAQTVNPIN